MKQAPNINPTILAIDSTSGTCSVSILKNNDIIAYIEEKTVSNQAKRLVPMIEDVLNQSRTQYSELSAIACTVGPGSFTGIRIGLATARAIGFAANIPVLGFSGLEVLAFAEIERQDETPILASLNAGKGEVIYQYFDNNLKETCPPTLSATHPMPTNYPRADLLARLAAKYPHHAVSPLPFYVRPPDAKLPNIKNVTTS